MKRLRRGAARGLLLLAGVLVGLAAAELVLAAKHAPLGWEPNRGSKSGFDDDLSTRYANHPGFYADYDGAAVTINSSRGRGPEADDPKIIALGDSVTFGDGLPDRETYPARLAARGFSVFNAGVPGYNSFLGARRLEQLVSGPWRPNLVIVYFGWNDHWRGPLTESTYAVIRAAAQHSRLAALLLRTQGLYWTNRPHRGFLFRTPQVPLSEFRDNLAEIASLVRRWGAVPVFVTPAWEPRLTGPRGPPGIQAHPRYIEAVRAAAAAEGVGLVDFALVVERRHESDPETLFVDFVHPNARGTALLASLLAPWARCAQDASCPPKH